MLVPLNRLRLNQQEASHAGVFCPSLLMSFDGSAALMNDAGKEGVEVKREGKLKLPWKRPLPSPVVGFQRSLIMS